MSKVQALNQNIECEHKFCGYRQIYTEILPTKISRQDYACLNNAIHYSLLQNKM